jgi:RNA methyltransferase, TrmH family
MLVKSQLKYIQSLGQKKSRDESGLFIAEGPKIVREILQEIPGQVKQVYAVQKWIQENLLLLTHTETIEVTDAELEKISQLSTPNQVLALVRKFEPAESIPAKGKITLVLETIQDPGNLGTIIRIADWFGVEQVICSPDCADMYNPKVVQASMSSIARVNVLYTDLYPWLSSLPGIPVYGAMLEGQDVTTMKKQPEGILLIGNESKGVSKEIQQLVQVRITIPQKGKAESLNAAVATGIILSHIT